jgi:hypothetical protein
MQKMVNQTFRPFRHQSLHGDFAISVVQHFEEPKKILRACATLVGGWYTHPSEKYDFVNWDHYYSQYMEK